MSGFPDHPEKFEPDWLAGVLGQPAGALRAIEFAPVGTGQVGDSFRLHLDWSEAAANAPATIIAKCPAKDPVSRETGGNMRLYEIETSWYRTLAKSCAVRCPAHFHADMGSTAQEFILLLEDMAPAVQPDQMTGASPDAVAKILSEAAHLHKFRWQDPALADIAWLNYGAGNQGFVKEFLPAVYPEWRARYATRIDANILDMGADLVARFDSYVEPNPALGDPPVTITHGDMRLDNMLFFDRSGRACLVDWQTVGVGAPMTDIAYCISTSLADPQERRDCESQLVADYLGALGPAITAAYSFEQAWQEYRRAAFAGFLMGVISAMLVERTERGDEMFAVMAERSGYMALDLDALSLV